MPFQTIFIFGLGLIGGSLAAAFKKFGVAARVFGVDHPSALKKALAANCITTGFPLDEMEPIYRAAAQADLIILAAPIHGILDWLEILVDKVRPGALITDVGSTKEAVVDAANKRLPRGVYFLGGHPMTGSEKSGIENANPLLFKNAVYVLTEDTEVPENLKESFVELITTIGAAPLFISAELHDQAAAAVSHLPQILATTMVNFVRRRDQNNPAYFKMAAGGFRDATRLAGSSFEIWRDIFATNQKNIIATIDSFTEELQTFKTALLTAQLADYFQSAAQVHHRLHGADASSHR